MGRKDLFLEVSVAVDLKKPPIEDTVAESLCCVEDVQGHP